MAAAALFQSVASKLARSPPPQPRPLVARGLRDGARSGPGSLPPLTRDQMARTPPPPPHHRLLHVPQHHHRRLLQQRGLHSHTSRAFGSTPTSDKEGLAFRLTVAGVPILGLMGVTVCLNWVLSNRDDNLTRAIIKKYESELKHLRAEYVEFIQSSDKQVRVDQSELEEAWKALFPVLKEGEDRIAAIRARHEAIQAKMEEYNAAIAELELLIAVKSSSVGKGKQGKV